MYNSSFDVKWGLFIGSNSVHFEGESDLLEPLLAQLVGHLDSVLVLVKMTVVAVEGEADLLKHLYGGRVVLLDLDEELLQLGVAHRPHHHQNHRVVAVAVTAIRLVRDHDVELSHVAYPLRNARKATLIVVHDVNEERAVSNILYTSLKAIAFTIVPIFILHRYQERDLYA